jgi:hypothetical protein
MAYVSVRVGKMLITRCVLQYQAPMIYFRANLPMRLIARKLVAGWRKYGLMRVYQPLLGCK